jgi:hypothetical protein
MKDNLRRISFLLLLVLSLSACADKPDKLWVSKKVVKLGEITRDPQGQSFTLELKNKSKKDLYISDIRTSCTCVYAKSSRVLLRKGDKATLTVEMKTANKRYGDFEEKVGIYTRNNDTPTYIKIVGTMKKDE